MTLHLIPRNPRLHVPGLEAGYMQLDFWSGPAGTRTQDHRIKSPVLYQLSYRPHPATAPPQSALMPATVPQTRGHVRQREKITKTSHSLKQRRVGGRERRLSRRRHRPHSVPGADRSRTLPAAARGRYLGNGRAVYGLLPCSPTPRCTMAGKRTENPSEVVAKLAARVLRTGQARPEGIRMLAASALTQAAGRPRGVRHR
jgi:hypothetical protein